ncbi:efflux RND transporter periplasmic adaptor subunit [Prochlorothrix hollandica]|uniref:efflux RND transporter periplasmic adaptor subunit n=1 Tax=Prochlorothrix hollandica TaxID=1223 RepID=UPI00036B371B|nr:efflux RND transporter periplasmic adaptor subunit [Prochlorothrix hollandica]
MVPAVPSGGDRIQSRPSPVPFPAASAFPKALSWVLVACLGAGLGIVALRPGQAIPAEDTPMEAVAVVPATVTALGALEPEGETLGIAVPSSAQGSRVEQLKVAQGDSVEAGQVLAVLDSYEVRRAAAVRAEQDLRVAEAQLAQVEAGAKNGAIIAQQAEIQRLNADQQARIASQEALVNRLVAEENNAAVELGRYSKLYDEGAISALERDSRQLTLEAAQQNRQQAAAELVRLQSTESPQLLAAQATLAQIAEVRPVDVALAQATVDRAQAGLQQALVDLNQTVVRSPRSGVVLDILAQAGERVDAGGNLLELGQLTQMAVRTEVYESDLQRVAVGQPVQVSSAALPQVLQGQVVRLGWKVQPQSIITTDPSATIDARVVEVQVALDEPSSAIAQRFTNLQVTVEIDTQ